MTKNVLQIFVKHPVAGQTKTRLAAGIGHPKALEAYRRLLRRIKAIALSLPDSIQVEIWYGNQVPEEDLWSSSPFPRFLQEGDDLGERMELAIRSSLEKGADRVVLVGSDLPHLTDTILIEAFNKLQEADVVLGPSEDGGYYLVGMNEIQPAIFREMTWSVDDVLEVTRQRLEDTHIRWTEVLTLNDLDTVEDLAGTFLEGILREKIE